MRSPGEEAERHATPEPTIRALVVDDEPLVRAMIRETLDEEPDVDVVGECRSGTEAITTLEALRPDVVFLDIRMPGLNGLEVAARLSAENAPLVVFVTAYDAHAVHAFELNALDYLLKPFDVDRVRAAMRRVRQRLHSRATERQDTAVGGPAAADELTQKMEAMLHLLTRESAAQPPGRFVVSVRGRLRVIATADVDWVEADDNYVRLHTGSGSALLRETMKSIEARLDPRDFVRVHRSALVRIARVRELRPTPSGDYKVHLASGAVVTMSRSYRDVVLRRLASLP